MRLFCAQLRTILTALAVGAMSALVLVVPAGVGVTAANAVDKFYLCHATGNEDSHVEVRNWVYNEPSDSGDAFGHAGDGHQNGLDIIPPIPGLLPEGQNWDEYGQQVHALRCNVPVTVTVTFTDNRCDGTTYVAPTMTAPDVDGTLKSITGTVAPGSTVTVTYTAKPGYGIIGQSTFTHTYPAEPSSAAYCDQPTAVTVHDSETACSLSQFGDFEPGTIRRTGTQEYVWDTGTQQWVLEPEADISWNDWTQAADDVYTDEEFFESCAPDQPPADTLDDSRERCDLSEFGDFEPGVIRRTGEREYVWNLTEREWQLEDLADVSWADWTQAEDDVYTDEEFFENCAPDQPAAATVDDSQEGCDLTQFGDGFEAGVIRRTGDREYVWNLTARAWELEPMTDVSWNDWTQAEDDVYTDEEFFAICAPPRPASVTLEEEQSGCDLTEFGEFDAGTIRRTGEREFVWNLAERQWELEDLADVSWADWTQAAEDVLSDGEYFDECATGQPAAELRQVSGTEDSCPLGGTLAWTETYTTEYVWDAELRTWVLGEEGEPVREEQFREWSQEKLERLCEVAGVQGEVHVLDHELDAEVEVKGVQETAPPTSVDAGLGTTPFSPVGARRNPLALIAIGSGLLLIGAVGRRKGATAVR